MDLLEPLRFRVDAYGAFVLVVLLRLNWVVYRPPGFVVISVYGAAFSEVPFAAAADLGQSFVGSSIGSAARRGPRALRELDALRGYVGRAAPRSPADRRGLRRAGVPRAGVASKETRP